MMRPSAVGDGNLVQTELLHHVIGSGPDLPPSAGKRLVYARLHCLRQRGDQSWPNAPLHTRKGNTTLAFEGNGKTWARYPAR
eukprot:6030620-Lingulodinium_polyedra.AAC.1